MNDDSDLPLTCLVTPEKTKKNNQTPTKTPAKKSKTQNTPTEEKVEIDLMSSLNAPVPADIVRDRKRRQVKIGEKRKYGFGQNRAVPEPKKSLLPRESVNFPVKVYLYVMVNYFALYVFVRYRPSKLEL